MHHLEGGARRLTRIGIFYDGGYFSAVNNFYNFTHVRRSRLHLAHFRCPTSVDFVETLPRTATGKLQKFVIREKYWEGVSRRVN